MYYEYYITSFFRFYFMRFIAFVCSTMFTVIDKIIIKMRNNNFATDTYTDYNLFVVYTFNLINTVAVPMM